MRIELTPSAWKAEALPICNIRMRTRFIECHTVRPCTCAFSTQCSRLARPELHTRTSATDGRCRGVVCCTLGRNRTCDADLRRVSLYPLSYEGKSILQIQLSLVVLLFLFLLALIQFLLPNPHYKKL
jgi:hypothetical protein